MQRYASNHFFTVVQLMMLILSQTKGFNLLGSMRRRMVLSAHLGTTTVRMGSTMSSSEPPKNVVFLGTPDVAASCLQRLYAASRTTLPTSCYNIVAVVTQPPAPAGRNKKLTSSPVQLAAEQLGLPVLNPETAKDVDFLTALEAMAPDLCITAAYGNYLPKRFLATPKYGTVNIHPSLLPKYRGAAPVQRCLERGDPVSGVTVLFTVTKMDAGPILAQHQVTLTGDEKASDFLQAMFDEGAALLVGALPALFDGTAVTREQDEALATAADKLSPLDARTDFAAATARQVHNKCRGLAVWPGLWSTFQILAGDGVGAGLGSEEAWSAVEAQRIKIITTTVLDEAASSTRTRAVTVVKQVGVL